MHRRRRIWAVCVSAVATDVHITAASLPPSPVAVRRRGHFASADNQHRTDDPTTGILSCPHSPGSPSRTAQDAITCVAGIAGSGPWLDPDAA